MAVEAVPVLEGLVADGAGHGALHAVHRLEVAPVHTSDHLSIYISFFIFLESVNEAGALWSVISCCHKWSDFGGGY